MALHRARNHGFVEKALSAVGTGMKYAATAKALYDVGRNVYSAARFVAPMAAALL